MKKGIVSAVLALTFAVSTVAIAGTVKCTVEDVVDDVVTMKCDKADSLKKGDKVKVKSAKKKAAAIEGC